MAMQPAELVVEAVRRSSRESPEASLPSALSLSSAQPPRHKLSAFLGQDEKPRGWEWLRQNRHLIIEHGIAEGILKDIIESSSSETGQDDESEDGFGLNLQPNPAEDSFIQDAIPYLPLSLALFCALLNLLTCGLGTLVSGLFGLCFGLPRLQLKECRRFNALLVNTLVAAAQFMTITFFLVGWFWSIAWGGLLITHALEYRQALRDKRQEEHTAKALEIMTRNNIMHRSNLKAVIREQRIKPKP